MYLKPAVKNLGYETLKCEYRNERVKIQGSHNMDYEDYCLRGCDTV